MKNIEKLKDLKFMSYREYNDLDNIQLLYIDKNTNSDEDVFTKKIIAGAYDTSNVYDIEKDITEMFINKVKSLKCEEVTEIDEAIKSLLSNKQIREKTNNKIFIIKPTNYILDKKYEKYNIINSDILINELIIGYKNETDEPGIVFLANENSFIDKKDSRFAITDIGFFPEKQYKIINIK
jgi:hypothetical protein